MSLFSAEPGWYALLMSNPTKDRGTDWSDRAPVIAWRPPAGENQGDALVVMDTGAMTDWPGPCWLSGPLEDLTLLLLGYFHPIHRPEPADFPETERRSLIELRERWEREDREDSQ